MEGLKRPVELYQFLLTVVIALATLIFSYNKDRLEIVREQNIMKLEIEILKTQRKIDDQNTLELKAILNQILRNQELVFIKLENKQNRP